jgi:hypothetical protein
MKHLTFLSVIVLVVFVVYEIIHNDSPFWNKDDLVSAIYSLVLGVMAVLTICLTFKMIYNKDNKDNKDDV